MKYATIIILLGLLVAAPAFARGGRGGAKPGDGCRDGTCEALPLQDIDETEKADLLYIREEEKLARDVYLTLYETHGLRVFRNISQAEQRHMDAVLGLLVKYEIPDPVSDNAVGMFRNVELRALYLKLVTEGMKSEIDALKVGATIEDLDINDLDDDLAETDNDDITIVYENLRRGSHHHLRAFTRRLAAEGVTYTPVFISQAEYDEIINSPRERGGSRDRGNGGGRGRGRGR